MYTNKNIINYKQLINQNAIIFAYLILSSAGVIVFDLCEWCLLLYQQYRSPM